MTYNNSRDFGSPFVNEGFPKVDTYADLSLISPEPDLLKVYQVVNTTGVWGVNRKKAGFYQLISTGNWKPYTAFVGIAIYDVGKTYPINQVIVSGTGILYRSLQNSNLGNTPITSPTFWLDITTQLWDRVGTDLIPHNIDDNIDLKDGDLKNVSLIDFKIDIPAPTLKEGRVFWNGKEYTISIDTGLGLTIQVGQETLLLYYNDTGFDIPNFSVLHPKSAINISGIVVPTPDLADASKWELAEGTLSVATRLIPNGQLGFAVRFGKVRGGNTSGFLPGQQLWLSTTPGELTNIKPSFPNYSISMGGTLNSELAPDGEIFISILKNIEDTFNDGWDGTIRETFDFRIKSDDGITTIGTLENADLTNNLTCLFSDGFYTLDTTTTPLTIILTDGSNEVAQRQYVYIDKTTKLLTVSTSGFPETEHAKVSDCAIFTSTRTKQEGSYRNQNTNDHIKATNDNGHILHLSQAIREKIPATHKTGLNTTATIGASNEIQLNITGGVAMQLHDQKINLSNTIQYIISAVTSNTFTISGSGDLSTTFTDGRKIQVNNSTLNDGLYTIANTSYSAPNFIITTEETISDLTIDGTIGDDIIVTNDFTTPNISVLDLGAITTDASGTALLNTSYAVVISIVCNKEGEKSHILANFPTDTYSKNFPEQAVDDAFNYTVYVQPKDIAGVVILSARIIIVDNGGTKTIYEVEDITGRNPDTISGGGGGGTGVTTFTQLTDTPSSYIGQANKILSVNSGETAVEFIETEAPKVTRYTGGSHTFTPDPKAKKTKIEIQAAGGSGGNLSTAGGSNFCAVGAGANSGNFYSCMIEEPIIGTFSVTVGSATAIPPSQNIFGYNGTSSIFGNTTITGGFGGTITFGGTQAVIFSSTVQTSSTINWGILSFTELLNIIGQRGTSPFIPHFDKFGTIVGGDGGEAHWGRASRSEVAIYSGARGPVRSINHDGSGYGFGGCGISVGDASGGFGNGGGAGLTIVTEYFQ